MADLFAGAALGTLTSELYKLVENLIKMSKQLNPLLNDIKATLDSLDPLIKQIEDKNKELNLSNDDIQKFEDKISTGIKLLRECSEDPKWYKKATYTQKLNNLDESLKRHLAVLTAQGVRDGKEMLLLARKQAGQVDESTSYGKDALVGLSKLNDVARIVWKVRFVIFSSFCAIEAVFVLALVIKAFINFVKDSWSGTESGKLLLLHDGHRMFRLSPDGRLLLSRFKRSLVLSGYFVVRAFATAGKSVVYCFIFYAVFLWVRNNMVSIRREYRRGLWWLLVPVSFIYLGITVYFVYWCILLVFGSINCHCDI